MLGFVKRVLNRGPANEASLQSPGIGFSGDFSCWASALERSMGYESRSILNNTVEVMRRSLSGTGLYEQDGVLLPKPHYSWPALGAIFWIACQNKGSLRLVDFGGSLGSTFFHWRELLNAIEDCHWAVVEQSHVVEAGAEFGSERLSFHEDIRSAKLAVRADVLLCSGTLQYLEDPSSLIRQIKQEDFKFLVFDRTPVICGSRDRLAVQLVPDDLFKSSYPIWLFSDEAFLTELSDRYEFIERFESALDGRHRTEDGTEIRFIGVVLRRKQK